MSLPLPRPVTVGRILHYWTEEAGKLLPNAALVVAVAEDGTRVFVEVFWASGFGGRDRLWASCAPFNAHGKQPPKEGFWTWPERV